MRIEGGAAEIPIIEYTTGWGELVRLAICADRYESGGALALLALNVTNPGDEEGYLEIWDVITVNLPGDPVAAGPDGLTLTAAQLASGSYFYRPAPDHAGELGAVRGGAGGVVFVDPFAPGLFQGVALQGGVLVVGADSGVSDPHTPIVREPVAHKGFAHVDSRTGLCTRIRAVPDPFPLAAGSCVKRPFYIPRDNGHPIL